MRYRIWFLRDLLFRTLEDSGYTEDAESPEEAIEKSRARGCGWGMGHDPTYKRAIAIPVEVTDEI